VMSSCPTRGHLVTDGGVEEMLFHFSTEDGISEINLTNLLLISVVYVYLGHPILLRHLDLDVDTSREIELQKSIDSLLIWCQEVEKTVVGATLELLTRLFVNVRSAQNGPAANGGGQRERSPNLNTGTLGRLDNLFGRAVEQLVIKGLQANADVWCTGHGGSWLEVHRATLWPHGEE